MDFVQWGHTFSKLSDSLSIYGRTVVIREGQQELTEVSNDGSSHAVMGNPFSNGLGLDIAKLFKRYFLIKLELVTRVDEKRRHVLASSTPSKSSRSRRSSYCFLVLLFMLESSISSSNKLSSSSLPKNAGARLLRAARKPRPVLSSLSRRAILASAARRAAVDISSKSASSSISASE